MITVLNTTLMVEKSMMLNFSDFKSAYLMWMAPAKSMKLNIPSSNNSLKLILFNLLSMTVFTSGKKFPTIRIKKEKSKETNIKPIALGSFKYLKLM